MTEDEKLKDFGKRDVGLILVKLFTRAFRHENSDQLTDDEFYENHRQMRTLLDSIEHCLDLDPMQL